MNDEQTKDIESIEKDTKSESSAKYINSETEIEKELEDLKDNKNSFFDLEKEFQRETVKINNDETDLEEEETDLENEIKTEFSDEVEEVDEELINNTPNILTPETISEVLANFHNILLPPLIVGIHKKIYFKAGEWKKIQNLLLREKKALEKNKNLEKTTEEFKLLKKYNAFCDFRDNKADLSEEEIQNLAKAWAWQIQKWGFSNSDVKINPLLQAYGMIILSKGVSIGSDKISKT